MTVKRRLVIYVQGYDPRGLAEYYRMFRREYRRTCELYGLSGEIGRADNDPERLITTWDATTGGDGWQVTTRYMFLRWEDIIRQDFARPAWWKIVNMYRSYMASLLSGVVPRIVKAHWRFGLFTLYPFVLMTFWILLGVFAGALAMKLLLGLGAPLLVARFVAIVTGIGSFASLLWLTERQTYLLYLCDDGVSTYQFANRQRPDWEKRMEIFAGYVVDAVRHSDADEVVIVGHSSGSFLAVDVLDRALARDPALGRHGPKLALLTVGANLPIVGFHRQAQWFRDRLRRLAVAPDRRLGRLPVAPRHHEFLAVRPGRRPRHRAGVRAAQPAGGRHQLPRPVETRPVSTAAAGAFSRPISSSCSPMSGWARPMITT